MLLQGVQVICTFQTDEIYDNLGALEKNVKFTALGYVVGSVSELAASQWLHPSNSIFLNEYGKKIIFEK